MKRYWTAQPVCFSNISCFMLTHTRTHAYYSTVCMQVITRRFKNNSKSRGRQIRTYEKLGPACGDIQMMMVKNVLYLILLLLPTLRIPGSVPSQLSTSSMMQWLCTHSVYNTQQIIQKNCNLKADKSLDSDDRNSNFGAPSVVFTVSIYYRQLGVTESSGAQAIFGLTRLFLYPDRVPEFVMINNAVLMYYGRAVIIEYVQ
jgi:hypothetical protein